MTWDGRKRPQRPQAGIVSVVASSASQVTRAVVFDVPFDTTPVVVPGWQAGNSFWVCGVADVTTTGFTAEIQSRTGATTSATVQFGWVAMPATQ